MFSTELSVRLGRRRLQYLSQDMETSLAELETNKRQLQYAVQDTELHTNQRYQKMVIKDFLDKIEEFSKNKAELDSQRSWVENLDPNSMFHYIEFLQSLYYKRCLYTQDLKCTYTEVQQLLQEQFRIVEWQSVKLYKETDKIAKVQNESKESCQLNQQQNRLINSLQQDLDCKETQIYSLYQQLSHSKATIKDLHTYIITSKKLKRRQRSQKICDQIIDISNINEDTSNGIRIQLQEAFTDLQGYQNLTDTTQNTDYLWGDKITKDAKTQTEASITQTGSQFDFKKKEGLLNMGLLQKVLCVSLLALLAVYAFQQGGLNQQGGFSWLINRFTIKNSFEFQNHAQPTPQAFSQKNQAHLAVGSDSIYQVPINDHLVPQQPTLLHPKVYYQRVLTHPEVCPKLAQQASTDNSMEHQMGSSLGNQMANSMGNTEDNSISNQNRNTMSNQMSSSTGQQMDDSMVNLTNISTSNQYNLISNQMGSSMCNQVYNLKNNQMDSSIDIPLDTLMDTPLDNPIDSPIFISGDIPIDNQMKDRMDLLSNNLVNDKVDTQIYSPMNNKMISPTNNLLNTKTDSAVNNQINQIMDTQIINQISNKVSILTSNSLYNKLKNPINKEVSTQMYNSIINLVKNKINLLVNFLVKIYSNLTFNQANSKTDNLNNNPLNNQMDITMINPTKNKIDSIINSPLQSRMDTPFDNQASNKMDITTNSIVNENMNSLTNKPGTTQSDISISKLVKNKLYSLVKFLVNNKTSFSSSNIINYKIFSPINSPVDNQIGNSINYPIQNKVDITTINQINNIEDSPVSNPINSKMDTQFNMQKNSKMDITTNNLVNKYIDVSTAANNIKYTQFDDLDNSRMDALTNNQMDALTDNQIDTSTNKQIDTSLSNLMDIPTNNYMDILTNNQMDILTNNQMDNNMDISSYTSVNDRFNSPSTSSYSAPSSPQINFQYSQNHPTSRPTPVLTQPQYNSKDGYKRSPINHPKISLHNQYSRSSPYNNNPKKASQINKPRSSQYISNPKVSPYLRGAIPQQQQQASFSNHPFDNPTYLTFTEVDAIGYDHDLEILEACSCSCADYDHTLCEKSYDGPNSRQGIEARFTDIAQTYVNQDFLDDSQYVGFSTNFHGCEAMACPEMDIEDSFTNAAFNNNYDTEFGPYGFNSDLLSSLESNIFEDVGMATYNGAVHKRHKGRNKYNRCHIPIGD